MPRLAGTATRQPGDLSGRRTGTSATATFAAVTEPPGRARVVIIGGGILGCCIAYWLTKYGERDVVLLEQHQLTDGATWHAAGLVGQLRSSRNTTRMLEQSVELYGGLEAETGQAVDWHQIGSLRLACSPERMMELRRLTTMAKCFGLPMDIISAAAGAGAVPADERPTACSPRRSCRPTATSIRPA